MSHEPKLVMEKRTKKNEPEDMNLTSPLKKGLPLRSA
jgi:hypothetical protein